MSATEILLIGVFCVLLLILGALVVLIRKQSNPKFDLALKAQVDEAIRQIDRATSHYTDVSAVVEMVRQLDADPDVLELIKSYPETVRTAAWLHYINALGADLQAAQKSLSRAHQRMDTSLLGNQESFIASRQHEVDVIRAKLDAAIAASGQSGLRPV
jgi:hypothetical protein